MTSINDELVFDTWLPMSYKRALGNKRATGRSWVAPTWVGIHSRRLQAYKILHSYAANAARHWLPESVDEKKVEDHREYGDGNLIVQSIMSSLLGEHQSIVSEGAEDYDPDDDAVLGVEPDADTDIEAARRAFEFQEWQRQWADDERFPLKLIETERNAVKLGDGVYTLGWNTDKGRNRLRVFDPGYYFPVLDDGPEDDFPDKVHIAWEIEQDPGAADLKVRRITWELRELEGEEPRAYDWNDKPSKVACFLTDAIWTFTKGGPETVEDFRNARIEYIEDGEGRVQDRDLAIDFIPVVHIPNTVALSDHYGQSSLAIVLQILDDLANADTDLQASSATTGKPPIGLSGSSLGNESPSYAPGEVWELGENGELHMLDTSRALDALLKYVDHLLKRISVNVRLPEAVLGRIVPSEVPSGFAMTLGFGPLKTMVGEMRLTREEKYPLLFKFNWRMAVAAGQKGVPPEYVPTALEFGPFLPQDLDAVITRVVNLLDAKAISLETAVRMLQDAGLPIEDAADEVQRIREMDFEAAAALLDALGDEALVYEFLGKEAPPEPPVETTFEEEGGGPAPPVNPEGL